MPNTWGGRSTFEYDGSVTVGTRIRYGEGNAISVSADQYAALRHHFHGKTVPVGLSRTDRPLDSLGDWLRDNVTATAIAAYVAPILILEGYASRLGNDISIA
jgi:hypothetical protein